MRFFDIFLACFALLILSPILFLVSLTLMFTGEGEVFFKQERVGRNGEKFSILKFATMIKDSPNIGTGSITARNDPRILPVGKVLRKTKLNELPQLINIVKGDMSIIGPRPHVKRDLEGVPSDVLNVVLKLKPGLSGLASIVFRNEETILQKFDNPREIYDHLIAPYKAELELWYFYNRNLFLYWKLILLTAFVIVFRNPNIPFIFLPEIPRPNEQLRKLLED